MKRFDPSTEPHCIHCGTPKLMRKQWHCANLKQHVFPKEKKA